MKISGIVLFLLSIWLLPCFAAEDGTTARVESNKPLNNRELHQLRLGFQGRDEPVKLRGTEIRVRVVISTLQYEGGFGDQVPRPYQNVVCKVLKPEKGSWKSCATRLISLRTGFFSNLKEGEEYLLEGIIADDDYDSGHFWVYANTLTRIKQAAAADSSAEPDSATESQTSVGVLLARAQGDAPDLTDPMPVREPLDNRSMHLLRSEMARLEKEGPNESVKLRGTEVRIKVAISSLRYRGGYSNPHYRPPCQAVTCEVLEPDNGPWRGCRANLINLRADFYANLKEGEEYLLEGIIADDHYGFGHFWIYPNKLTKVEQGVGGQPADPPRVED